MNAFAVERMNRPIKEATVKRDIAMVMSADPHNFIKAYNMAAEGPVRASTYANILAIPGKKT